eukprot:1057_1
MLLFSLLWVALCAVFVRAAIENPSKEWEEHFEHYTFLNEAHEYRLYWTVLNDEYIEIGLEAESTGWVGFGVSDDGQMINADMVLGWIDENGETYLQRRHTTNVRTTPTFDYNMIEDLQESEQNDTITRLSFIRELFPCDEHRKQIVVGTTQVLFAVNDDNPSCTDGETAASADDEYGSNCIPSPHAGNKMGRQAINFFSGVSNEIPMPETYETFDFVMSNFSVPADDTTYHCKYIEIPQEITTPSQMIRYDPVVQPGNEGTVHHMLLYYCKNFNTSYVGHERNCDDYSNMEVIGCSGGDILIAAWAIGGPNYYFPQHVGYPFNGKIYAMIEIHYDNPNEYTNIVDSSGLRVYWTQELRQYTSSFWIVGIDYNGQFIPGDIKEPIVHTAHSPPECTQTFPEGGVKVFTGAMHSHTLGVKMKLRHFRNNVELPSIFQNDNYDFDYQMFHPIDDVEILPGDELQCECTYYTEARTYPTYGGESTQDEMCQCWLVVYPGIDLEISGSTFSQEQFKDFFDVAIENEWFNGTNSWVNNSRD